jgi:ABC-type multidrug transport system ATPase subunit
VCDAKHISKHYINGGSPFHLQPLDVKLRFGEITGIVGENGNGKTTLLRILAGELSSDTGNISYPALQADDTNWYKVKNQFVFIPQRILSWHGSLVDNLRFFASIHGFTSEENNKQAGISIDSFKNILKGMDDIISAANIVTGGRPKSDFTILNVGFIGSN